MKAAPVENELTSRLRWVSDIVRTVESFLPAAASPWTNGYAREPGQFIVVALLLVVMLLWGSWLAGKIKNRMDIVWREALGTLVEPLLLL